MTDTRELTDFTIRIAREAGAIAMEGFRNRDLDIDLKRDFHDMVTKYDTACEDHLRREILSCYADSTIVAEEAGTTGGTGALTWYIDPIDGTANFARGIAMWAVSIGVAVDDQIVVGVVYDPANDHLFWADDRGAFLGDEPMRSWGFPEAQQATVAASFPLPRDLVHFPELAVEHFGELVRTFAHLRTLGSSTIGLCWVAAGWIDATFAFESNPWDVAASAFIIRRAGGTYRTYHNGEPQPEYQDHRNRHYLATVPGARYELIDRIMREQSKRPV